MGESSKWTDFEKRRLFGALQRHGPDDIKLLRSAVMTKSEENIIDLLFYYRSEAAKSTALDEKNKETVDTTEQVGKTNVSNTGIRIIENQNNLIKNPLYDWLDAISESCSSEYLKTLLPDALRLIAYLEKRPKTKVDLKSLYISLADVLSGESEDIPEHLFESLQKLTSETKSTSFLEQTEYLQSITRIFPDHREANVPSPTDSVQTKAMLKLQSSVTYNPLAIPINFLVRKKKY